MHNITEQTFPHHRPTMTLTERVHTRRALDTAADETYPTLTPEALTRLARIMNTGMRRVAA